MSLEESFLQRAAALRPDNEAVEFLQTICSLAAPVWPLELYGPVHRFNWISLHETYNKWLRSREPSILHVYGTTGASDASEYIFQCLNMYRTEKQTKEILLYFAFNGHDDRCNSVTAMLNTLLSQAINHNQDFYDAVRLPYEQMSFHSSWTEVDLLLLFRNTLTDWDQGDILCVINGLNECDDSRMAFLESICAFASHTERRFKIAITSTGDSDLKAALADWPNINLDERPEDPAIANRNLVSDIDLEVLELMQQRPTFCDFEKTITEKLLECGQDEHWRRLVLNQLRLSKGPSTKSATQRELNVLPPTTSEEIFARILTSVPPERRPWARKALSWILYAFRPLGIRQFGIALALEVDNMSDETRDLDEFVYQYVIADLDEVFKGMFIVKHNEVHFGHPDARKFLLAADSEQEHVWYDVKETAHKEITDACCFYLSLQKVQDSIATSYINSPTDLLESPTFIPRYSLRSYAIKYWPRHYELIPNISRPTERAVEFFLNTKAMRRWAEAYWWLSNPIRRADRAFLSLLPIFAGLGLVDLVTKWLDLEAKTSDADQNRALALEEAARNAQVEVVRGLLPFGSYNQESLQGALIAAASCCDEVVLDELVTYAAESIENFEWPPVLLCRAAQFGLENVVKKLLKSGASLDTAITVQDLSPLHLAARHGHTEVVRVLLEHNASLTSVISTSKRVPLHVAAMYGHAPIVKLLLDAKANCNVLDDDMTTAMDFACMNGNHQVVEILAKAGCDMGCDRQGRWSPLTVVADEGFIKSCRFLLDMKANTEVQGMQNWTPLRYAAFYGHVELCRLLLKKGANPNTLSGGDPILVESASQGNLEVVTLLVENNAVVDAVTSDDWTALHKACFNGHTAVVAYLLDHGADIHHTNNMGQTSILLAARRGFAELVQFLIDKGADLHRPSTNNWTPLHLSYDFAEVTRVLMENGADANRVMRHYTPLYLAANENYVETVKVLLSFNPDLEIEYDGEDDQMGYTALTIATVNDHTDVIRLLLEAGANVNHRSKRKYFPLEWAVSGNKEDIVRILMEYNTELNLVDDDGDAALNCIRSSTSVAIAKLLINRGADLTIRNNQGNTPLCKAVMCNNLDIVKYLIAKKAELNITGGKNGSPLHIACYQSNLELVRILAAADADVNLVDPLVGTPLQSACCCQRSSYEKETQESIIRYLINEAKADVTTFGGLYGCVLNAACGRSTPEMVKLILEKGAKIDVKDGMGRVAIHFAVARSMENFQLILDAGGDVEARDKMGRTALHWAAIGGLVDVVARVISLSRGLVDQADNDGWTPLLWAVRGCDTSQKIARSSEQREIIKVLLDRGADPFIRGKGLDREWSPVKVARYHGTDDAILQLLMEKAKDKLIGERGKDMWDETLHASAKAVEINEYCDSCLSVGFATLSPLISPITITIPSIPFLHSLLISDRKGHLRYPQQVRDLLRL
jgi:ankyrin repeat protein